MMRRLVVPLVISLAALGVVVAPSADASTNCAVTWGSGPKTAGPSNSPQSHLVNVRTGRHTCFDRMVFDLDSTASGYSVRYVTQVHTIAKGNVLPLAGGARLEIVVRAPAYDDTGHATYPAVEGRRLPGVDLAGYRTFREARYGGSFEGLTLVGLGVRARLPFRVSKLGNRVVLDVANRW